MMQLIYGLKDEKFINTLLLYNKLIVKIFYFNEIVKKITKTQNYENASTFFCSIDISAVQ